MIKKSEFWQEFYKSEIGQIARGIILSNIAEIWPELHGMRIMGCGYAMPYLDYYMAHNNTERVIAQTSLRDYNAPWPSLDDIRVKGSVVVSGEAAMPIETCSVDRVLLVHHIENCDHMRDSLREIWRVLKPNGRMLVVVPNRVGMWARADWSPFGVGHTFTQTQITHLLKERSFVIEDIHSALYVPPLPDSPVMMRSAKFIERWGAYILPFVAGVHILEVSKQVYARADDGSSGTAVVTKTKQLLGVKPVRAAQRIGNK